MGNPFRMSQWLLLSVVLYILAGLLAAGHAPDGTPLFPQVQTIAWKLGHLNIAAFFGYRIDRSLFRDKITKLTLPELQIRRAIIVVGTMIALALAM